MAIENEARLAAAELVDEFARGELTNFEFEERWPDAEGRRDPALRAIGSMLWNFYSDSESHALRGRHAPNHATLALLRRCSAFLRTALPYEWREVDFSPPGNLSEFIDDVLRPPSVLKTGAGAGDHHAIDREDRSAWPFRRLHDAAAAGAIAVQGLMPSDERTI